MCGAKCVCDGRAGEVTYETSPTSTPASRSRFSASMLLGMAWFPMCKVPLRSTRAALIEGKAMVSRVMINGDGGWL